MGRRVQIFHVDPSTRKFYFLEKENVEEENINRSSGFIESS